MSNIPFHPLSNMFPLMQGEEFDALVEDIRKNGQREPIVPCQGKVLDGRNRHNACLAAEVGFKISKHEDDCAYIGDPAAYVISKNVHRRHLTAEQKRELIAKLLKAAPEKSNRQIAETVKADHKTVAAVRSEEEATGEIPQLEKTVGADGKARKRPAKKRAAVPSEIRRDLESKDAHIDELESAREHDKDRVEQLRAAEIAIGCAKESMSWKLRSPNPAQRKPTTQHAALIDQSASSTSPNTTRRTRDNRASPLSDHRRRADRASTLPRSR